MDGHVDCWMLFVCKKFLKCLSNEFVVILTHVRGLKYNGNVR